MAENDQIQELQRMIEKLIPSLAGASRGFRDLGDEVGDVSAEIQGKLKKAFESLQWAIDENASNVAELEAETEKLLRQYDSAAKGVQRYKMEIQEHNKAIRHSINAQKNYCDRLRDTGEHYGKLIGLGVNLGSSFGAQSIGLRKLVGSVKDYNENLFKIQRTQQVFGRGIGDLAKAFNTVDKQTALSRGQFLQFTNTMLDGYKGIKPSVNAMADFASVIQKQFNPSLEETIRVGKEFLDVYDKFPAAGEAIKDAMELATKGNLNEQEKRRLNTSKAMIASMYVQGKMTAGTYDTFVKGMQKTTKEQQATIDYNKKLNKSSAQVEDALLEVGKKSEGALKLAADATTFLYTGLQSVAGAAAIATASMAALNMQASALSTINLMRGFGGGGGAVGRGAAFTASTGSALKKGGILGRAKSLLSKKGATQITPTNAGAPLTYTQQIAQNARSVIPTAVPSITEGVGGGVGAAAPVAASRFARAGGLMRGAGTMGVLAGAMSGYGAYTKAKAEEDPNAANKGLFRGAISTVGAVGGAMLGSLTPAGPLGTMVGGAAGGYGADMLGEYLENKIWPKTKEVAGKNEEITDELSKQVQEYQKEVTNNKYVLDTSTQLAESTKLRLDMMVQLNQSLRDQDGLLKKQVEDYANQSKEADKVLDNIEKISGPIMKMTGIDWVSDSTLDNIQNAQKAIEVMGSKAKDMDIELAGTDPKDEKKMNELISVRTTLLGNQKLLQDAINEKNKASVGYVKASVDVVSASARQEEDMNSVYTERLATQRQLMESAQFGFGASVAMLQQQVDLEYELMKVQQDRIKRFRQTLVQQHGLTEEQVTQLEGARNYNEAQNMITKSFGKTGDQAKALIGLSQDFQKSQSETMKHQQKIYELTKEMREGYMDSFREMSANVGEFSKIIGTQETGITQLMKTVEEATGEKKLNTMKGGVMVTEGAGGYDARKGVAGRYTVGGAQFRGQGEWESLNQDVYGYGKAPQGPPVAGGAVTDFMKDGGAGAFRDALEKTPAGDQATMATAVRDGVIAARDNVFINPSTASGRPLGAELGSTDAAAHGAKLVDFSVGVAGSAQIADPARNVPTTVGNLPISPSIKKEIKATEENTRAIKRATAFNVALQKERSWRGDLGGTRWGSTRERPAGGGSGFGGHTKGITRIGQTPKGVRRMGGRGKFFAGWNTGSGGGQTEGDQEDLAMRARALRNASLTRERAINAAKAKSREAGGATDPVAVTNEDFTDTERRKVAQEAMAARGEWWDPLGGMDWSGGMKSKIDENKKAIRIAKKELTASNAAIEDMKKQGRPKEDTPWFGGRFVDLPAQAKEWDEQMKRWTDMNARATEDLKQKETENKALESAGDRVEKLAIDKKRQEKEQGGPMYVPEPAEGKSWQGFASSQESSGKIRANFEQAFPSEAKAMKVKELTADRDKAKSRAMVARGELTPGQRERMSATEERIRKGESSYQPGASPSEEDYAKKYETFVGADKAIRATQAKGVVPFRQVQVGEEEAKSMAAQTIKQMRMGITPVASVAQQAQDTIGWGGSGSKGELIVYMGDDLKGKTEGLNDMRVEIRRAAKS